MADSFKKLKNRRWEVKGKAITELAEMNVENAFGILMSLSQSRNNILKATALNALGVFNIAFFQRVDNVNLRPLVYRVWMACKVQDTVCAVKLNTGIQGRCLKDLIAGL